MSERKKSGPKWLFDDSLGKGQKKNPAFPEKSWPIVTHEKNKVLINEMSLSPPFCEEIWRLGAEQKAKRLNDETKKAPPEG